MTPELRAALDPANCPICGEWRDAPDADCANCGWAVRPCGDVLGLCVYAGTHEGPHKFGRSWVSRLEGSRQPANEVVAGRSDNEIDVAWSEAEAVLPEGWELLLSRRREDEWWLAQADTRNASTLTGRVFWQEYDPSPSAALRALAARLASQDDVVAAAVVPETTVSDNDAP